MCLNLTKTQDDVCPHSFTITLGFWACTWSANENPCLLAGSWHPALLLVAPPVLAPLLCASEPCSEDAVPVPPLSVLMAADVTLESIGRCQCPYHCAHNAPTVHTSACSTSGVRESWDHQQVPKMHGMSETKAGWHTEGKWEPVATGHDRDAQRCSVFWHLCYSPSWALWSWWQTCPQPCRVLGGRCREHQGAGVTYLRPHGKYWRLAIPAWHLAVGTHCCPCGPLGLVPRGFLSPQWQYPGATTCPLQREQQNKMLPKQPYSVVYSQGEAETGLWAKHPLAHCHSLAESPCMWGSPELCRMGPWAFLFQQLGLKVSRAETAWWRQLPGWGWAAWAPSASMFPAPSFVLAQARERSWFNWQLCLWPGCYEKVFCLPL